MNKALGLEWINCARFTATQNQCRSERTKRSDLDKLQRLYLTLRETKKLKSMRSCESTQYKLDKADFITNTEKCVHRHNRPDKRCSLSLYQSSDIYSLFSAFSPYHRLYADPDIKLLPAKAGHTPKTSYQTDSQKPTFFYYIASLLCCCSSLSNSYRYLKIPIVL